MKIAIAKSVESFTARWIDYCEKSGIPFIVVNPYDTNVVLNIRDCDVFLWHHSQNDYKDALFANQLLFSLETSGKKVFPDFNTTWHFDDKLGQKYLLEAIDAPMVSTHVFYSKKEALDWLEKTSFPIVFKLRGGAGSKNVRLIKTKSEGKRIVKQAFNRGFKQYDPVSGLKEKWRKYRLGLTSFNDVMKGVYRLFFMTKYSKMHQNEKGYIYFQDFIPNNTFDIRVCVIGNKAFALKRKTREGDFRASGSGNIVYDRRQIDERCVQIAFDVNRKLKSQSIAYDFVFDVDDKPLIVEISYGYLAPAYDKCEGYWTDDMQWHDGKGFDFCGWIIDGLSK